MYLRSRTFRPVGATPATTRYTARIFRACAARLKAVVLARRPGANRPGINWARYRVGWFHRLLLILPVFQ